MAPPIEWLLAGEPHVRYRTLTDLLGRAEDDGEVLRARRAVRRHGPVRAIFARQHRSGRWGSATDIQKWWPRTDTTFWVLGVLADFGLRRDAPRVAAACEYVLGTQQPCGAFGWAPPPTPAECFTGILAGSLAACGYGEDPRLGRVYDWLLARQRPDGGFWCKNTGQPGGPREGEPSCAFASLCVAGALAEIPRLARGAAARRLAGFLLGCWERRGTIRYAGHDSRIGTGWERLKYPFTDYRILRFVDVLSRLPAARRDARLGEVVDLLLAGGDPEGRFRAGSIHRAWSDFDFGQKREPSRWLTLLVHRVAGRVRPDTSRPRGPGRRCPSH
ncbi:MAG: terpene cyclase/mutase family protein [Candidatus Krumholzibacteriota bacterium]|nr:terpene cyclase/mutase family protein [Candidatus Krumholzibacteriota bacterium]